MPATTSQPPPPHPRDLDASGALYGDTPLAVPRKCVSSPYVIILSRLDGVTEYTMRRPKDNEDATVRCKIDTRNEFLLMNGIMLHTDGATGVHRIRCDSMALARVVALQQPSDDPDRIFVDHANLDTLDNTAANLHWVTPSFNKFNVQRTPGPSGFFGVKKCKTSKNFAVKAFGRPQGRYDKAETAALVYNLIARQKYGSQLERTPRLLNQIGPDSRTSKVETQSDGVEIFQVDSVFIVVYDGDVRPGEAGPGRKGQHNTLKAAQGTARRLVEDLQTKKKTREEERAGKLKTLTVTKRQDGFAYLVAQKNGEEFKVLLSDETWLDIVARDAKLTILGDRPSIIIEGRTILLSRWLLNPSVAQVVDHINGNIFDHRMTNLRVTDRSANQQNIRRSDNGYVGVHLLRGAWVVRTTIKGEYRVASKSFLPSELDKALELYDLTALYQHGSGALINLPDRHHAYLEMLTKDAIKDRVKAFLAGLRDDFPTYKHACHFDGGYQAVIRGKARIFRGYGAEIRAAIYGDLYRLKLVATDLRVNFERMRPWYLHHLPGLDKHNELEIVEQAYQLLGGDAFVKAEESRTSPTVQAIDASSTTTDGSSPGSTASRTPSTSRKRKASD